MDMPPPQPPLSAYPPPLAARPVQQPRPQALTGSDIILITVAVFIGSFVALWAWTITVYLTLLALINDAVDDEDFFSRIAEALPL